jgi:hypothetical protein
MSKLEKKDEIDIEKLETGLEKSLQSGLLAKSKTLKNEVSNSKSMKETPNKEQKTEDKNSNISFQEPQKNITQQQKNIKKYNSATISGYHTFNNNISSKKNPLFSNFDFNKFKNNFTTNGNIIKRIKEFEPAEEYLDILYEIDEGELNEDIYNNENTFQSKEDKDEDNKEDIKSEEQNLKFDNKKSQEVQKIINNIEIKSIKDKEEQIKQSEEIKQKLKNQLKNKQVDIYNINSNLDENKKEVKSMGTIHEQESFTGSNYDIRLKRYIEEYEKLFQTYSTNILFKYGEYNNDIKNYMNAVLLLKNHYIYVLNNTNIIKTITEDDMKFFNPDISLISCLNKKYGKNILELKNEYNLSNPLLCINLNLLSCKLLLNKKYNSEFSIRILGNDKKYSFIINDDLNYKKFTYIIFNMIKSSEGAFENKLGLSLRNNNFYKDTYINVSEFESMAKTGDIILFRSTGGCPGLQRLFTCDMYDHVGIIIIQNNRIQILESTSLGKCTELSWNCFKYYLFHLIYTRISYRRLNYENKNKNDKSSNQKILEKNFNKFLKEIRGKDYYLSITNFICCKSPQQYEYNKDFKQAEGFCCSALVAAIYIKLGIMKLERSVHCVKPGDFEQDRNRIIFEDGYSLGSEKIIEFSE